MSQYEPYPLPEERPIRRAPLPVERAGSIPREYQGDAYNPKAHIAGRTEAAPGDRPAERIEPTDPD